MWNHAELEIRLCVSLWCRLVNEIVLIQYDPSGTWSLLGETWSLLGGLLESPQSPLVPLVLGLTGRSAAVTGNASGADGIAAGWLPGCNQDNVNEYGKTVLLCSSSTFFVFQERKILEPLRHMNSWWNRLSWSVFWSRMTRRRSRDRKTVRMVEHVPAEPTACLVRSEEFHRGLFSCLGYFKWTFQCVGIRCIQGQAAS